MSTEQSLNPELIEQTKQQIRTLVNEIAQLAKSDISPQEFYAEFLTRVVSALAAVGGIVWALEDEGRLALQYQINLQKSGLRDNEEGQRQHGQLLSRVMTGGEPVLVPPHSGISEDDDQATNPTDYLLVLGPLKTDVETIGVVEILQRPEARHQHSERLPAVSDADVRPGRRLSQKPPVATFFRPSDALGPSWRISPAWFTPASIRDKRRI